MSKFGENELHKVLLYSSLKKEGKLFLSVKEEGHRRNSRCYSMHGYWEAEFKSRHWVFTISFAVSLYSLQQVLSPTHQIIFLALLTAHSGQRLFAIEPVNYWHLFYKVCKKCWVHTWYYFRGQHLFMQLILPIHVVGHCSNDCIMELWGWFLASDTSKLLGLSWEIIHCDGLSWVKRRKESAVQVQLFLLPILFLVFPVVSLAYFPMDTWAEYWEMKTSSEFCLLV